uniref:Acetyltransferase component of pyruvate dehydrogenase complex n=1 Tax=Cavenderia deminutiva TaxID=361123 RepID=A0A1L2FV42_9MYCE|nr:dihydrolipoamide acetyltransferase [Cavenderia deminutiva]
MPALSPTMTEGNIAQWVKKEGDRINVGDVIAQVETDKATMDFESQEGGYLAKILIGDGAKGVQVNTVCIIYIYIFNLGQQCTNIINYIHKEDIPKFKDFKEEGAPQAAAAAPQPTATAAAAAPAPKQAAAPSKNYPKHTVIGMPALSPSMESGGLAKWLKNEGDKVNVGDVIAQVETDKATMDFECQDAGYVAKILVQAGASGVGINDPICVFVSKKEDIEKFKDYTIGAEAVTPASPALEQAAPSSTSSASLSSSSSSTIQSRPEGGRIFATPAARVAAKEKGFSLNEISGTGPNSRIVRADVLSFVPKQATATSGAAASESIRPNAAAISESISYTDIPHSNIRRVTAARLTESKQTIPHYYLTMECKVDELLAIRGTLNGQANGKYKLSVNDFIIKAAAAALRDVPTVNSTWMKDVVRRFHNIDINVAVNTDIGLFTPLVRDADKKGLATVANSVRDMAEKAKAGKLQPADFASGTFTISNLGMFGIKNFSAVINPPQAAILAIGTTEKKVVVGSDDKSFTTQTVMSVTLSCDHRVIDGAVGAEWLQAFKNYMENPLRLLL